MIKTNLHFELYSAKILYLILIQSDIVWYKRQDFFFELNVLQQVSVDGKCVTCGNPPTNSFLSSSSASTSDVSTDSAIVCQNNLVWNIAWSNILSFLWPGPGMMVGYKQRPTLFVSSPTRFQILPMSASKSICHHRGNLRGAKLRVLVKTCLTLML